MTHFGVICPASTGHLNSMTALGHGLQTRGHRVTLIGVRDVERNALAAGLEYQAIGEKVFPPGAMVELLDRLGQLSGLSAVRYTAELFRKGTMVSLDEAPQVIKRAGVEAMLVDQASFTGGTIAEHLDIPFATICCALMLNREPGIPPIATAWQPDASTWGIVRNWLGHKFFDHIGEPVRKIIVQRRQRWNLPTISVRDEAYSKLAQLSQQPAEFEFPRKQIPLCFHFTGPYHSATSREPVPFPFDRLSARPLVYVSMGSVMHRHQWIYRVIADACEGLDVQLVMSVGKRSNPQAISDLPGSPLVVEFTPQLELLKRATLLITHAGLNSVIESLSNAVPMVAIPITNDQPGGSARIQWTRTG